MMSGAELNLIALVLQLSLALCLMFRLRRLIP